MRIGESLGGERIDRAVALLTGVSRADAVGLVVSGRVRLNGVLEHRRARRLAVGDLLEVVRSEVPEQEWIPATFTTLHEDDEIIVLVKPAGVLVHPVGRTDRRPSVVGSLVLAHPGLRGVGDDPLRPGVFQRLDLETSGVMAVALNEQAFIALKAQAAGRRLGRRYLALLDGDLSFDEGTVDAPIGREPGGMAIDQGGRDAVTHLVVRERFGTHTLVEARLETGRTHQIRVHAAAIGHPVVGDLRYGRPSPLLVGRHFLHASELSLCHPRTGEELRYRAPLPAELQAVVAALRR